MFGKKRNFLFEAVADNKKETIADVFSKIEMLFQSNPTIEREVQSQLTSIVSQLYHSTLSSSDGYCIKFSLPIVGVNSLFKKMNLVISDVELAFRNSWGYPKNTKMYSDSYYHILLLLITYGLKKSNQPLINNAMLLMLIKLWNGRRQEYLPFCNPNVKFMTL